ncbi:xylulokinase [Alkalicoccus daliensis]|uniref:Sugar (Pentulose or hexulose) kinase n=1 Tax=Alkalicoccus daliensis TaxID=745820 RepID=A0A1H0GB83_9BACI|nr:FGGY-family carbohydrate kinase [Alkalicoccus daliensis]SDO04088.1 Sugar (pentulose or hexulose) kinase [Alkalicoccus daliensis]
MDNTKTVQTIQQGNAVLGIELGSTRIKAVLIDENNDVILAGNHNWENSYINNTWTYSEKEIWEGIQSSYQNLNRKVEETFGFKIESLKAIGLSGMMHGYLVFDKSGEMLVPFRTWRNNFTGQASEALTEKFSFNIPQRWSIAHLYQAILNDEAHVKDIDYLTTLAGYIHWKLTGQKVLGVGEASGVFPIDSKAKTYNKQMTATFSQLIEEKSYGWKLENILPEILTAGEQAGSLTDEGAKLLDPEGKLAAGVALCPPEGDAGTGMVATNSVATRKGNVSAGTSAFAMVVMEKELSEVHPEIDPVATPAGAPVAMAHSNNCTSDINAWVSLFKEFTQQLGVEKDDNEIYSLLFEQALQGDRDAGGLLSYGYLSGEHVTHFEEGRPLFARSSDSNLSLANFMRTHIFTAFAAMKIGMDILIKEEKVELDEILAHGGIFKTEGVAASILAGALNTPVSVMKTADEGGAWGAALLASYMANRSGETSLEDFLNKEVFSEAEILRVKPKQEDVTGFEEYMERYKSGLAVERAAVENLK